MAVTIRDIAKATGLSLGTISRALKKSKRKLTEATRVQVFEVARQLGYDFSKLKKKWSCALYRFSLTSPAQYFIE